MSQKKDQKVKVIPPPQETKIEKEGVRLVSTTHEHERRGRASAISIGHRGGASCEPRSEVNA